MIRISINDLLENHIHWRNNLPENTANQYISLSRKFLHKLIEQNGNISGITLSYPEDCSDYDIFLDYINIFGYFSIDHIDNAMTITFH